MRLWSLHPRYLDPKGLVALWREALLAQNVLLEKTCGYKHHPQLQRFKATRNPAGAIASYLRMVADEADQRGYRFDRSKIAKRAIRSSLPVTHGQLVYELGHLLGKLKIRDLERYRQWRGLECPETHPLFVEVGGDIEDWEII